MPDLTSQDSDYLRLLGIFHYVLAGIAFLFAIFPIFHLIFGIAMVSGALDSSGGDEIPRFFGWFFVSFAGAWIVFGVAFVVALVVAGWSLRAHRHHTFCLVIAGLSCMFVPLGTVLGVFTIMVLMKDPVKEVFATSAREGRPAT
jgi:hypothetical protein